MVENKIPGKLRVEEYSKPKKRKKSRTKSFALILLVFSLGIFIGRYVIPAGEFKEYDTLKFLTVEQGQRKLVFPTFWEAWDKLHAYYLEDLDDKNLFYGAVEGMVRAAGDPYTVFSRPADTNQFEETIGGSFGGVGIEIGMKEGAVTVIAPIEGSPADQAGMKQGDVILAVDGENITKEMTIDDVVQKIRGERGEVVTLTVYREGENKPLDIDIVRDVIEIASVKLNMLEGDIAHVVITSFNADTAERFNNVVRELRQKEAKGIIVDVRNNPGGFLQAAADMSSRFLEKGKLVVAEKGNKNKDYTASGNTLLKGMPTVLLVNGGSASASEILAGALHDQLGVPIVGVKTFGKGSVQEFIKLSDESSLRITVAKWYTPEGRSISDEGIEPTIEVEQNYETEEDEQLQRAKEEVEKLVENN